MCHDARRWRGGCEALPVSDCEQLAARSLEAAERNLSFDDDNDSLEDFLINDPVEQISAKGYAITSVYSLDEGNVPQVKN